MDKIERFNNLKLDQKTSVISWVGAPTNLVRQAGPREIHLYVLGPAYVDVYCNGSGKVTDAVAFTDVERINDYLKQMDISGLI
ncbi:MAG: hypothetical protein EOO01_20950 [Chitinophagaceae bacterium]|nr:MAG: hypothetical protein EOO01_20950 [Chitinophagaceae bacterium]